MRFLLRKKAFQFVVLPFGLSSAPKVFALVFKALIQFCRRKGIRVIVFLNDILVLGRSYMECLQNRDQVLKLLRQLGFQLNHKKSSLIRSQVFTYFGLLWNAKTMQVSLPLGKNHNLRQTAQLILSKTQITCRQAMRFLGKVNHAVQAVPEARLHFRIFQRQLISIYRNQFDLFKLYTVSDMAREDLIWWANLKESSCTMSLLGPQEQTVVESDASPTGWGAIHEGVPSSGIWSREVTVSHHINELEMLAVENALHHYCPKIQGKVVQVKCDNRPISSCINLM